MSAEVIGDAALNEHDQEKPGTKFTIEEYLGGALMLGMVAVLLLQVITRAFGASLTWSEEIARYMFIWLVYLCLGTVALRGEHITIDMAVQHLPLGARRIVAQIALIVMSVINIVILVRGFQIVYVIFDLGQPSPAIQLPMWMVYLALPVGLTISVLRSIQASIRMWQGDMAQLGGIEAEVEATAIYAHPDEEQPDTDPAELEGEATTNGADAECDPSSSDDEKPQEK